MAAPNLTAAQIFERTGVWPASAIPGGGGGGSFISAAPSLKDGFLSAVARTGLSPVRNFQFGTSGTPLGSPLPIKNFGPGVTADPSVIPITSLADLATYFNDFEDGTGLNTINSEIQRFQPFNSANHVFASDRLNLQALLPGGAWAPLITQAVGTVNLNNTANPIANLGLANTTGLRLGQVVAVEFKGLYVISAIVVDTSVSLTNFPSSPTTAQTNNLIAWLPIDSAALTVASANGTTLTFASVPAAIQAAAPGAYQIGFSNSGGPLQRAADSRVQSATATTVTTDQPCTSFTLGIGTLILFVPTITSGQIWTKDSFDITSPDCFFAVQGTFNLFNGPGSSDFNTNNPIISTLAQLAAVPADFPWGAVCSFWTYGANDPAGQLWQHNSAEMDFFEIFENITSGIFQIVGGDSNSPAPTKGVISTRIIGGWAQGSSGFLKTPFSLAGDHTFGFIYTGGRTYRYVDDVLWQYSHFEWYSSAASQVGCDLQIGALNFGQAANFLFPQSPAGFANSMFGIKNIKVWYAPQ
jgi:hypothetical protein